MTVCRRLLLALMLCLPVCLRAADNSPEDEIRGVAVEYVDALANRDTTALGRLMATGQESWQQTARDLFLGLLAAENNLARAAARFGDGAVRFGADNAMVFSPADRAAVATGRVLVHEGSMRALLFYKTSSIPLRFERRSPRLPWRVAVNFAELQWDEDYFAPGLPAIRQGRLRTDRYDATTKALISVATRITSGQLATAAAAEADLAAQLQAINDEFARRYLEARPRGSRR